ncbi:MAG: DUF1667 domain-containing protein [Candidatus Odinarchaeia archaeon]
MANEKNIICVICPLGCVINIQYTECEGKIVIKEISGYKCDKGKQYATKELLHPSRVLTTSVKVKGGNFPLVSVKTDKPVPKEKVWEIIEVIKRIELNAPVKVGQTVYTNILNMGINLIATRDVESIKK